MTENESGCRRKTRWEHMRGQQSTSQEKDAGDALTSDCRPQDDRRKKPLWFSS